MTVGEFAEGVATIGRRYKGSVTSWGRTTKRAMAVGGFAGDPHTWWVGADMVYDDAPPDLAELQIIAKAVGLKVIREDAKPHDHFQPWSFPAGAVLHYAYTPDNAA